MIWILWLGVPHGFTGNIMGFSKDWKNGRFFVGPSANELCLTYPLANPSSKDQAPKSPKIWFTFNNLVHFTFSEIDLEIQNHQAPFQILHTLQFHFQSQADSRSLPC